VNTNFNSRAMLVHAIKINEYGIEIIDLTDASTHPA